MIASEPSCGAYAASAFCRSASERSAEAAATARMASSSRPWYARPPLEEMREGTSSAAPTITLHSSMYFSAFTAPASPSECICSNASKK